MRKFGSVSNKTIKTAKIALLIGLGHPKTVIQLFFVVCFSYFLFVRSTRYTIDSRPNGIDDSIENHTLLEIKVCIKELNIFL